MGDPTSTVKVLDARTLAIPDTIPTPGAIMCGQKDLPPPDESQGKRREAYRSVLY